MLELSDYWNENLGFVTENVNSHENLLFEVILEVGVL